MHSHERIPLTRSRPSRRVRSRRSLRAATLVGVLFTAAACDDSSARPAPTAPSTPVLGVNNGGNNRRILFASTRDDAVAREIYSMNPDGTGVARLTNSPGEDMDPAWSPDGKQVAFVSRRDDAAGEIYVMNADGSGLRRLTFDFENTRSPTWSKDGKRIAFVSSKDDEANDIYVMNAADGSGLTRVTTLGGEDADPTWSPDGKQLAFVSARDATESGVRELYVVTLDGLQVTRLTFDGKLARNPSWAPGGKQIAFDIEEFVVSPDGTELLPSHDIYVLNLDTRQLTRLTDGPLGIDDSEPSWSPDGKQIAYSSRANSRAFNAEIFVMNANGTGVTRLTTSPAPDDMPAWNR